MNSKNLQNKIGRVVMTASLLLGMATVFSLTAQAQGRRDGYDRGGYGRSGIYEIAQDQGFRDGLNTGANDASRRQSYDPYRSHFYRNATFGYRYSFGNREAFKQAYRNGFLRGYQDGFRRIGGNRRRW